jgi:PhnB protein
MRTIPYLGFNGDCAEAFRFYADVLRGEVMALITHGDTPAAEHVPPDWHARIMHAHLEAGDVVLFGGDSPPGDATATSGFAILLDVDSADEAERIFAALADGGRVTMPLEQSFWAERFGMLVDRFGTPWMLNYEGAVSFVPSTEPSTAMPAGE